MYTIEHIREGRVIVDNINSNPALIRKLMKRAFPESVVPSGNSKYYFKAKNPNKWDSTTVESNLPENIPIVKAEHFPLDKIRPVNIQEGDTYIFEGRLRTLKKMVGSKEAFLAVDENGTERNSFFNEESFVYSYMSDNQYSNYKPVNNNKNNKKSRETTTVNRSQRTGTSIISSSTRQIASASRLVGNSKNGRIKETRVGRFEIKSNSITT